MGELSLRSPLCSAPVNPALLHHFYGAGGGGELGRGSHEVASFQVVP